MPETRTEYWNRIQGFRTSNVHIREAVSYFDEHYEETDEVIRAFVEGSNLSNEEFITFIAIRRLEGLRRSSGNASSAMMDQIRREYKNTPWKFVEEFLQNADDCTYDGTPEIQIIVDERKSSIEFIYNEHGFTRKDIWSLTQFSDSTKPSGKDLTVKDQENGLFYNEKTGRKGIGFKSVFSLDAENVIVHIHSNGFGFKLDNEISSIVPVWENPGVDDGKTHIRIELINANFSLRDIYPQFKELFCVSNRKRLFIDSPILFMHKLRAVRVEHRDNRRTESFAVSLQQNEFETEYGDIIRDKNDILSGISYRGKLCSSELARINLTFQENGGVVTEIPCLRYSETIKVNGHWNIFSVISPIIQGENTWEGGSLFRTFPMIDHGYPIPFAMNLPYELNMARKGISYSDAVDENRLVSDEMFKVGGVFRSFLYHLRTCEGISIDQYFSETPAILFDDTNNRNRDGYYVPLVDLKQTLSEEELFPLYKNEKKYVSLKNLACLDEQFLDWPMPQKMLELLLGTSFVDRLVARKYLSCNLLKQKRTGIIDHQFVTHMNAYLQLLEQKYGCENGELSSFLSSSFYPFLCKNENAIVRCDGFRQLSMYLFEVFDGSNTVVVRENFKANTIWIDGTTKPSYRNYRTLASSKTDLSVLLQRNQPVVVQKRSDIFSSTSIQRRASAAVKLSEILNEMEEAVYYGGNLTGITFDALSQFALSEEVCDETNPFRDAHLLEIITRNDAVRIARSFKTSLEEVLFTARAIGLREADDFFDEIGNFWQFNSLSRQFLSIDNEVNAAGFLHLLDRKLFQGKRKLDITYEQIKNASTSIKLYLMRKPEYIVREAYDQLCTGIIGDAEIWRKKCNESTELLLRAVSKVTATNALHLEQISIDVKYLVENRLGTYAKRAVEKYGFNNYLRLENHGFFERVSKQEVTDALLATELDDSRKKEEAAKTFYRGDLSACHSEGKAIEFLIDTLSNSVYLHGTAECDFRETFIYKYLQCKFDAEKDKLLSDVRKRTRNVYDRYIRPTLERTNDDWDSAFEMLSLDFERMSKEDVINIIARFRLQSYAKSLGNASQSHENEIAEDYRQEPWKFAYEFLQNTDDCSFPENVMPEIAVAVSQGKNSITFEYNEMGFTLDDIHAITSFGNSQKPSGLAPEKSLPKDGVFDREKTGRKGRGFKSVFALPGKDIVVHIQSNGFSFRFEKRLGEIIPIWEKTEDAACMGTKITIEGFPNNSIHDIYERLLDTLFVKNQEKFFSASPLLFLKQLRRISLSDGMKTHRFEIEEENAVYPDGDFRTNRIIASGIREKGAYKASQIAQLIIHQFNAGSEPIHVKAMKASYMKEIGGHARVISLIAPVITASAPVRYNEGSLYRTLPMDHHKLPIPFSVNAAFNLNSGRSALIDEQNQLNIELNKLVFEECLPKMYTLLRDTPSIAIDAYIPHESNQLNMLYSNLAHVARIDLRRIIRNLPLLRCYSGKRFVSCENARVLSSECYAWPLPVRLAQIFDNMTNDNLILQEYCNKIDGLRSVQMVNACFCEHLNKYLDVIENNNQTAVWSFLSDKLYAYISKHYDDLRRSYIGNEEGLLTMQIFAYTDANDQSHRENGSCPRIWLMNCPAKYKSYSVCRVFDSAPVRYNLIRDGWIVDLLHAIDLRDFRAENDDKSTWDKAVEWLKVGLYYECTNASKLTYLQNCVLCEPLSPEDNIFRKAFARSNDKAILQRIITEQDVAGIVRELSLVTKVQQTDVINAMKSRGLRKADDFFATSPEGIKLNKPTLAVFHSVSFDRAVAKDYVQTVTTALKSRYKNASLDISFAELKSCSPVLFSSVLRLGLLAGEVRSHIAKCFFEEAEIQQIEKTADYVETYLCCMSFVKERMTVARQLSISLAEIKLRKLGELVQLAQFSSLCAGSSLTISRDIPCENYESREIKKSLHWLSEDADEETEITKYSYYTADISDAFVKSSSSQYVFDGNTVIVSEQSPQEHVLDFVKHKYTAAGNKELLVGLIQIASQQYELQENWHGTPKEFITKLATFRTETDKYVSFLCPGYQRGINEATGDTVGSLIPELLQNINDCRGGKLQKTRTLAIEMDNQAQTMTLTYDERGFQFADVYSITAYGQSTKHDEREGEKGLGFKKVFTIFSQVEIYSNGFSFSLSDKKPTIPQWVEPNGSKVKHVQEGKTTMVFKFASPERTAERIRNIWESAMNNTEYASLFLGLRNITAYRYCISAGTQMLTRDQILQKYYYKEVPLVETYKQMHSNAAPAVMQSLRNNLRTRRKCSVMNNTEFEQYLKQLMVAVYFPRKVGENGLYYSTLPTAKTSGCSMFIDVPLELSTGRNEIMVGSRFNDAIMRMLYYPDGAQCSVMSHLLASIAKENDGCKVYEYIPNVSEYLKAVAGSDLEEQNTIRAELCNLPIVRPYQQGDLIPVSRSFTAPRIVYDYMHIVKERITLYDAWLRKRHPDTYPLNCVLASDGDGRRNTLRRFAIDVGVKSSNYPLCGSANDYDVEYFETEYGTEVGE